MLDIGAQFNKSCSALAMNKISLPTKSPNDFVIYKKVLTAITNFLTLLLWLNPLQKEVTRSSVIKFPYFPIDSEAGNKMDENLTA